MPDEIFSDNHYPAFCGHNCIYIDSDTSLWSIAYMYDQGYSIKKIMNIQKEINKIILDQVNGIYDDMHPSHDAIKELL
ncbi:MAG: hypothetical protein NTW65_06265 [Deltaproteobacteria bacterium]|nr:hypothetical protein [Deltaproteobacteria bacterium]